MNKKQISSTGAPAAIGPYSQAIQAGDFLYVSGVLPIDPSTGKVVEGTIETLLNRIIDNMEALLKAAGMTLDHVVKTDVFMKDLNDFQAMNKEYAKRFHGPVPPARTTVQVAKLPLDVRLEIACIAYKH